jgi:hypothetical protein
MQELIGKEVEVSTYEITYIGRLVEIGEKEIHLESDQGWITILTDRVVDIKEVE